MARKTPPFMQPKKSLIVDLLAQRPSAPAKRKEGTTLPKQHFLIVCEGEATEPNYFNSLRDKLPLQIVEVEISGEGRNTIGVVKAAMKKRDTRKLHKLKSPYDAVYAVFDKDDHDNYNEAIRLAENEAIVPIYSNEAFELWYVLHFQYNDTGVSRKQYMAILEKNIGNYQKNSKEMYDILQEKGNEAQAIKWAEKLHVEKRSSNPANDNPITRVFEIVARLNEFK